MSAGLNSVWTDQRVALLRKLDADGLSAGQIAGEMGVSRNAIIGKIGRLNIRGEAEFVPFSAAEDDVLRARYPRGGSAACVPLLKNRNRREVFNRAKILGLKSRTRTRNKPAPTIGRKVTRLVAQHRCNGPFLEEVMLREIATAETDLQIPQEQRRTLLQLTNNTCRFPIGEGAAMFFCGHPSADLEKHRPYCNAHFMRCTTPVPTRRDQRPVPM